MAKRVILAVAGAGKTYHICHEIDPNQRNLILAFTNANIHNIQRELCEAHGCIPEMTTVSTFDSFVYHELVLAYEPSIAEHFNRLDFRSRGICTIDPPGKSMKTAKGMMHNPAYVKKTLLDHYVTKSEQYYCATLSELVLQVKKGKESLVERVARRLNLFYDNILIDEFQDFREYDYQLIVSLTKLLKNVLLVGDYYQHSVSGRNNTGTPFKKGKSEVCYEDFVQELLRLGFEVDLHTLSKSRRCSKEVCDYINQKLGIEISSCEKNDGTVIWGDDRAEEILNDSRVVKLVYESARDYSFEAVNWSYSKGDTVDSACVILTQLFENLDDVAFSPQRVSNSTLNKLYVAMTRTRGNLYLIKASTFNKLKANYKVKKENSN